MKLSRTHVKLIVVALAIGIALAAWVRNQDGPRSVPCHANRIEKRDASGKVVEIKTRTCIDQHAPSE